MMPIMKISVTAIAQLGPLRLMGLGCCAICGFRLLPQRLQYSTSSVASAPQVEQYIYNLHFSQKYQARAGREKIVRRLLYHQRSFTFKLAALRYEA
jgi:hypothetical protein